jgi:Fur family peroxide stress response transcriptional regulator
MKKPGKKYREASPYRRSRQRERILELLQSTSSHPTANWLYAKLRKDFPHLSMGTVYRNIGILIEQGRLSRIAFGSTFDRLDANMEPHYHFLCEECDSILDLDLPVDPGIDGWLARERGYVVRRHELEFHGLCPKCAAKA